MVMSLNKWERHLDNLILRISLNQIEIAVKESQIAYFRYIRSGTLRV